MVRKRSDCRRELLSLIGALVVAAVNDKVIELVQKRLKDAGLKITGEGDISGKDIDEKKYVCVLFSLWAAGV